MTRDNIIRLAKEAGLSNEIGVFGYPYLPELERFAALVADATRGDYFEGWEEGYKAGVIAEREACAKVCEETRFPDSYTVIRCAAAIRARGEEQPYATQAAMVESQTHGRMQIDPATGNVSIGAIRARGET